jgi:hypothetical protein
MTSTSPPAPPTSGKLELFGELMEAKPGLAKDLMSLFFGEMTTRLMHHCYGNGID